MLNENDRFKWTAEQRAQVVPGATVVVRSPMLSGRRAITEVHESWLTVADAVFSSSVPWHFCDPDTLCIPPDPRQLALFSQRGKP